jgi:BirA family biotin operon repressor/biotin-[acetyl-CoA-carboxylase] ligase
MDSCPLSADEIRANLKTRRIGKKILVYNSTSSTNDVAAEYATNKRNDGLTVFAEEQTAGRGRAGAKWIGGRADSVICSIVLTKTKCSAELLSLTLAVAVAEAVGKGAKIKWPNDIMLNDKKVAGILLESKTSGGEAVYILGIGINCHQNRGSFPAELQTTATSIDIEAQTVCDRVSLAKRLLSSIDYWLGVAEKDGTMVIEQWRGYSLLLGRRVRLIFNGSEFAGNCVGIDPEKGLILQLDSGGTRFFDAAHTTIAK